MFFWILSCQNAIRIPTSLLWWCLQSMLLLFQSTPPIRIPSCASGIHWNYHHLIESDSNDSIRSPCYVAAPIQGSHSMSTFDHFSPVRMKPPVYRQYGCCVIAGMSPPPSEYPPAIVAFAGITAIALRPITLIVVIRLVAYQH